MLKRTLLATIVACLLFSNLSFAAQKWRSSNPLHQPNVFLNFGLHFPFTSVGFAAGGELTIGDPAKNKIYKYFTLGGRLNATFNTFAGFAFGVPHMIDLSAIGRAQYPFATSIGPIAPYVLVPLGATIGFGRGAFEIGMNFGVIGGARWFFTQDFGVYTQLGVLGQFIFNPPVAGTGIFPRGEFGIGATYAF